MTRYRRLPDKLMATHYEPWPDQDKVVSLLRQKIFSHKAVARGSGVCYQTVYQMSAQTHPLKSRTVSRIAAWMHEVKQQMP